ncbi:hypothetical protein Tco_0223448 [Tanacetum coccineum]
MDKWMAWRAGAQDAEKSSAAKDAVNKPYELIKLRDTYNASPIVLLDNQPKTTTCVMVQDTPVEEVVFMAIKEDDESDDEQEEEDNQFSHHTFMFHPGPTEQDSKIWFLAVWIVEKPNKNYSQSKEWHHEWKENDRDSNGIEMLIGANFLRSMKGGIRIEGHTKFFAQSNVHILCVFLYFYCLNRVLLWAQDLLAFLLIFQAVFLGLQLFQEFDCNYSFQTLFLLFLLLDAYFGPFVGSRGFGLLELAVLFVFV